MRSWPPGILGLSSGQQYVSGPSSSAAPRVMPAPEVGNTQNRRRCTACGQSGHYRSNKKYTITLAPFFLPFADLIIAVGSALCIWTREGFEVTVPMINEAIFFRLVVLCYGRILCDQMMGGERHWLLSQGGIFFFVYHLFSLSTLHFFHAFSDLILCSAAQCRFVSGFS